MNMLLEDMATRLVLVWLDICQGNLCEGDAFKRFDPQGPVPQALPFADLANHLTQSVERQGQMQLQVGPVRVG